MLPPGSSGLGLPLGDHGADTLSIRDPMAPDNDVGRACFAYFRVRKALEHGYHSLTAGDGATPLGSLLRASEPRMVKRGLSHAFATRTREGADRVRVRRVYFFLFFALFPFHLFILVDSLFV
jgi:hypothetical protein